MRFRHFTAVPASTLISIAAVASMATWGCGSPASSDPAPSPANTETPKATSGIPPETPGAAARTEPKYTVTRVVMDANGAPTKTVNFLTTEQMVQHRNTMFAIKQAKKAGRFVPENTVKDQYCEFDDVMLADNWDLYGSTICFVNPTVGAPIYLYNYPTGDSWGYWDEAVHSYTGAAGDTSSHNDCDGESGYLTGWSYQLGSCREYFSCSDQTYHNSGACGLVGFAITLTN